MNLSLEKDAGDAGMLLSSPLTYSYSYAQHTRGLDFEASPPAQLCPHLSSGLRAAQDLTPNYFHGLITGQNFAAN